jgi:hypothetical protein
MKKYILPFLFTILMYASCKDAAPIVIPKDNPFEVLPVRYVQNVLLESFVAEWTSETIQTSLLEDQLKLMYPNRLFVANLHVNDWLEIPYTNYLSGELGGLLTVPRAAINRTPGTNTLLNEDNVSLLSSTNWQTAIEKALKVEASLCLSLETGLSSNKTGFINVYIAHKDALVADTRIGIYLVQDGVPALFQTGATDVFIHNNVLSNVLPSMEEDTISIREEAPQGEIIQRSFSNIDLKNIDVTKLKAIVFIYTADPDFRKIRIINSQEVKWGGNKYWD